MNKHNILLVFDFQRFGVALVREGELKLKSAQYKLDMQPIDANCECSTCKTYTRSYLHHIARKEEVSSSLLTVHNVAFQVNSEIQYPISSDNN